jgi:hypothetical protein
VGGGAGAVTFTPRAAPPATFLTGPSHDEDERSRI